MSMAAPKRWFDERRSAAFMVFACALIVRCLWLTVPIEVPAQDTPDYDEIALNLVSGQGFVSHDNWFGHPMRSWRAPLYPALLASVYGLWGYHHWIVQVLQAFVGACTAVGVLILARRLHPPSGLVVGLIVALYPSLIKMSAQIMTETLFAALLVAALVVATGSRFTATGSGLLVGLATLTRPVGLLLAPALVLPRLWSAWRHRDGRAWLASIRRSAWMLVGLVLVLSPWTIRNGLVHDAFVPVSTHGGFILAGSNAHQPQWRQADGWQIQPDVFAQMPNEVERDRYWRSQAWTWIAAHPLAWLRLVGERFLRFWYVFRPDFNVGFTLWVPLILVGAVRFGSTPAYREITGFSALSVLVFSTLLYGSTRFRLPMEPLFLLYVGPVLSTAWASARRRMWIAAGVVWVVVNLMVWWKQEIVRGWVLEILYAGGLK